MSNSYGSCNRCGASWEFAQGHHTEYHPGRGCFPLCEACWSALTPETRLPFYRELYRQWEGFGLSEADREVYNWAEIERAVLEGK